MKWTIAWNLPISVLQRNGFCIWFDIGTKYYRNVERRIFYERPISQSAGSRHRPRSCWPRCKVTFVISATNNYNNTVGRTAIRPNAYNMLYYKTNMIYRRVVWGDVFQRKYFVIRLSPGRAITYVYRICICISMCVCVYVRTRITYYYSPTGWRAWMVWGGLVDGRRRWRLYIYCGHERPTTSTLFRIPLSTYTPVVWSRCAIHGVIVYVMYVFSISFADL